MLESITSFLYAYRFAFLALHILSMAIGLGGATISDIMFFRFLKDYRISKKEAEVLDVLKTVVLSAMFVIIFSGFALYIPSRDVLNTSAPFLIKVLATAVLFVNGMVLHMYIAPHLLHVNLRNHKRMGRGWHKLAFALGGISLCSWYSIFGIAMLKELLHFSARELLFAYLLLLAIAITGSQITEKVLSARGKR